MADTDIVQVIAEARIDAQSLSEFIWKPANFMVTRRLAPSIHTLDYYIDLFDSVALSAAAQINKAIVDSGFIVVDSFESGATITERNQVLRHTTDKTFYRWLGDLPKTVPSGSTPLTSGGLGSNGWLLVNFQPELIYPSLYALITNKNNFADGVSYITSSFYYGKNEGYGHYVYSATTDKSKANGGSIIDPDNIGELTGVADMVRMESYLSAQGTGVGKGCLIKLGKVRTVEMYGGLPNDPSFNTTSCFRKMTAVKTPTVIELGVGTYYVKGTGQKKPAVNLPSYFKLKGAGQYLSTLKNMDSAEDLSVPVGSYGTKGVTIEDFGVDGNNSRSSSSFYILGEGMDFDTNVTQLTVRNVYIRNTLGEGLDIDSCTDLTIDNLYVENCYGNGLHISDLRPPKFCNISNVTIVNCSHGRGATSDPRSGGMNLRASRLNISNVIIKDCFRGILFNGEGIVESERLKNNLNNIQIYNSTEEDIVSSSAAPTFNIQNFFIKRGNDFPTCMNSTLVGTSSMSDGEIVGSAEIVFRGSLEGKLKGVSITDVIAPDCVLSLSRLGSVEYAKATTKINGSTFKDVSLETCYSFQILGNTLYTVTMVGGVHKGIINSNIIHNTITPPVDISRMSTLSIQGNILGGLLDNSFEDEASNVVMGNMINIGLVPEDIPEIEIPEGYTPVSHLTGSRQGAYFNAGDISTLFQDIEGLIPVTANGQKVALMKDISGLGNHAKQPDNTKRPIYKVGAHYDSLTFDGINDFMIVEDYKVSSGDTKLTASVVAKDTSLVLSNNGLLGRLSPTVASSDINWSLLSKGAYSNGDKYTTSVPAYSDAVSTTLILDTTSAKLKYLQAEAIKSSNGIINTDPFPLVIGMDANLETFGGSFYSAFVVDDILTDEEIAILEKSLLTSYIKV